MGLVFELLGFKKLLFVNGYFFLTALFFFFVWFRIIIRFIAIFGKRCFMVGFKEIHHEITLKILEFIFNSIEKVKSVFFTFLIVYVSWIEQDKILVSQLPPPKFRYFANQNGQKRGPHEDEFWQMNFSNSKMSFLNSKGSKGRWKKWGHLSGFHVSFLRYGP